MPIDPDVNRVNEEGVDNEVARSIHESKSYVDSALLTLLLYYAGLYIVGLIANFIYLAQAKKTRAIIRRNPSGMGFLQFLLFLHFWLPLVLGLILMALLLAGVFSAPS